MNYIKMPLLSSLLADVRLWRALLELGSWEKFRPLPLQLAYMNLMFPDLQCRLLQAEDMTERPPKSHSPSGLPSVAGVNIHRCELYGVLPGIPGL